MKGKKPIAMLLAACMIAATLSGCGSSQGESGGAASNADSAQVQTESKADKNSETLHVAIGSDPSNLAPNGMGFSESAGMLNSNIYARLMHPDNGEYVYDVATSIEYEDDLHLLIKIRDDVYDQDGNHLTASDVLYSMNLCTTSTGGMTGLVKYIDFEGSEVVDETTLRIALTEVQCLEYDNLATINLVTEAGFNSSSDEMVTDVVATGPYTVVSYNQGSSIELKANDKYYGDKPKIENVVLHIFMESSQMSNAIESGEVQYAINISSSDVQYLDELDNVSVEEKKGTGTFGLFFNCSDVFSTADARKAVCYAVDSDAIINVALDGYGIKAANVVPDTFPDAQDSWFVDSYYEMDMAKAQELAKAEGLEGKTVRVIYSTGIPAEKNMAEIIQNQLSQIGITAELTSFDDSVYNSVIIGEPDRYDIAIQRYDSRSGIACLNSFITQTDFVHMVDPDRTELGNKILEAVAVLDAQERAPITDEAMAMANEMVPIYAMSYAVIYDAHEDGLNMSCKYYSFCDLASAYWE